MMIGTPLVDTVVAALVLGSITLVLVFRAMLSWFKYRRAQHAALAAERLARELAVGRIRSEPDHEEGAMVRDPRALSPPMGGATRESAR